MPHVSDFTQEEDKIVLDLINEENGTSFSLSELTISNPEIVGGPNVRVTLTPTLGTGYGGNQIVNYRRLSIQSFMDLFYPGGFVIPLGDAVTTLDFLDEVNAGLGTNITSNQVVSVDIGEWEGTPNETKNVNFVIATTSKVYHGVAIITVDGNDIPLENVLVEAVLSGLNLPVLVTPDDLQPIVDSMLYPFEANIGATKESVELELARYLGVQPGDISIEEGTVFPNFNTPVVSATVRVNNPDYWFAGEESTIVEFGLGRYDIPNPDVPSLTAVPAQWTWDANRGWYNDVNNKEDTLDAFNTVPGLAHLEPRMKRMGASFTSYPMSNGNGLGINVIAFFEQDVWPPFRFGTHDPYNGQANHAIYENSQTPLYDPTERVRTHLFRDFAPPGQRPTQDIRFGSAFRTGFNKTLRGMRDLYMEFYVTKNPPEVITYLDLPLKGLVYDMAENADVSFRGWPNSNRPVYATVDGESVLAVTTGQYIDIVPKPGKPNFLDYPEWNLTFELQITNPTAVRHELPVHFTNSQTPEHSKLLIWKRNQSNNRFQISTFDARYPNPGLLGDPTTIPANTWRKFSIRKIAENSMLQLYVNDVFIAQSQSLTDFSSDKLVINGGTSPNVFAGRIKNLKLTNK